MKKEEIVFQIEYVQPKRGTEIAAFVRRIIQRNE